MPFLEDLLPELWIAKFGEKLGVFSDSFLQNLSESMANIPCGADDESGGGCRDNSSVLILKLVAIAAILIAGFCGVAIPLVGKKHRFLRTDSNLFVIIKAFAAGVILATGFVHILPDATEALTDSCLQFPWTKFPFAGFIAMMAALATLLADFLGTQYYKGKQDKEIKNVQADLSAHAVSEYGIVPVEPGSSRAKVFGEEETGAMHIVGMRAHAAHHGHSHSQEQDVEGHHHQHGHSHEIEGGDEDGARHIIVSQVLELGIVSHSVIIGLSLGVSHSPCTVRPLIAALSFHQFFEGFALGGCISQAKFGSLRSTIMACCFALTTPLGIAVGIGLSSIYNANSPKAVLTEGIFDSISAGILIYMALVDLIAADFMSKRMSCNMRLQVTSYFALFLGAILMSLLAIWA